MRALALLELFLNPGLLAGLALLSAPIIIHLLNKRHFKVVEWAAMDFLLAADSKQRRRLRLEDLILLLLRILILGLIVFALARPLLSGFGSFEEAERIVVLDDSFSMEAGDGTTTSLALARAATAAQIEAAVGKSTAISVWSGTRPERGGRDVLGASPGEGAAGAPAGQMGGGGLDSVARIEEAAALLAEVRGQEATDLPLRLGAFLEKLSDRLGDEKEPRLLVMVSDLRASDWFEDGTATIRSEIQSGIEVLRSRGLLDRLRWQLVDVGLADVENLSVKSLRVATDLPFSKLPVRLVVEVENHGMKDRLHVTGEVEIAEATPPSPGALDGDPAATPSTSGSQPGVGPADPPGAARPLASRVIHRIPLPAIDTVSAGKTASTQVEFTFEKAGDYLLTARVEPDRLTRDDSAQAVVRVRDGLRVLLVDGEPGRGRFAGESGFLISALAPRGRASTGIFPRRLTGAVRREDLSGVDVVFLLNRDRLEVTESEALESFVASGGGLVFFLGTRVRTEGYPGLELFPARLGGLRSAAPPVRMTLGQTPHPAFDVFRGIDGSSLEQVGFARYFDLEPLAEAVVAARLTDAEGTPFILERPYEKGHVALFNTSADRDWSDWPTDPSFVVALLEWVRFLAPSATRASSVLVGEPLAWEPAAGLRYRVLLPDGRSVPAGLDSDGTASGSAADRQGGSATSPEGKRVVASTRDEATSGTPEGRDLQRESAALADSSRLMRHPTALAGFHCVLAQPTASSSILSAGDLEPRWFAVHRGERDSRLERAGEDRLRAALEPLGVRCDIRDGAGAASVDTETEGEVWRPLAYAAGVVLLIELLVAWWFGRG